VAAPAGNRARAPAHAAGGFGGVDPVREAPASAVGEFEVPLGANLADIFGQGRHAMAPRGIQPAVGMFGAGAGAGMFSGASPLEGLFGGASLTPTKFEERHQQPPQNQNVLQPMQQHRQEAQTRARGFDAQQRQQQRQQAQMLPTDVEFQVSDGEGEPVVAVDAHAGFRYFRIIQTGTNSSGSHQLSCAGLELYGVLTEDENSYDL
jgi:hypothetical protein